MKKTGVTMKINLSPTKTGALYMAYQKSRDRVKELETENKKMREALEYIARSSNGIIRHAAHEATKTA